MPSPKKPVSPKADAILKEYMSAKRGSLASYTTVFEELYPDEPRSVTHEIVDGTFASKSRSRPAAPEYPDVTSTLHEGSTLHFKGFSELFPDEWKILQAQPNSAMYPDFLLPSYTQADIPEHLRPYVPANSDYIGQAAVMYDTALAFATGSTTHLVGWPGTGKSNGVPVKLAAALGLPLLRLSLNKKGMMLDDLIGREAIVTDDTGTHTRHRDGVLCHWVTHPCIILADEFARANAEITNGLMSLMERNGALIVENRDPPVMARHEQCFIIASDNVKGLGDGLDRMVGTDMVDGAVLDRFEVTIEVDYLDEEQTVGLIQQWFPGFPDAEARKLAKFAGLVQEGYKKNQLPLSMSPRAVREVARYTCIHKSPKPAVRKVFLQKLAEEADIEAVKNMFRTAYGMELA